MEHVETGERVHFKRVGNVYNMAVDTALEPDFARAGLAVPDEG